jgi:hypothetical protein
MIVRSRLLPIDAVLLLVSAAQTPVDRRGKRYTEKADARVIAIERAAASIRRNYPKFFRKEVSHVSRAVAHSP